MTIEQLKEKIPWINVTEWMQHPLGEGWKHRSATVPDDVKVPHDASIGDRASIGDGASIGRCASIGDGASIGRRASIGDGASIGRCASIGDGASIGDRASIGENHRGFILCIQASAHQITVCCPSDEVQIGCHRHPISYWLEHGMAIAKNERYSEQQAEEYGILLNAVSSWIDMQKGKGANDGDQS